MKGPHVLVAAFRPFGGRRRNASAEALRAMRLPARDARRVRTLLLPVSWRRAFPPLERALARPGLAAVVLTGEAGRRAVVTAERWGRNRAGAVADVDGRPPPGPRLLAGGAARRRATWDAREVAHVLRAAGVPARESRDAGGFLCNAVLYRALEHGAARRALIPVTFVHLPVAGAGARADLTAPRLARAVRAVVRAAVARFAAVPSRGPARMAGRPARRAR